MVDDGWLIDEVDRVGREERLREPRQRARGELDQRCRPGMMGLGRSATRRALAMISCIGSASGRPPRTLVLGGPATVRTEIVARGGQLVRGRSFEPRHAAWEVLSS
jgi:hypothetical protein